MEDTIYNTYEKDVSSYVDFEMPIPTYIFNSKIDFSVIISILLVSNSNPKDETYRYINYNKLNKQAICNECGISRKTLERKLKYLEEQNIINLKNTSKGYVYIINYSKEGRYFVRVQYSMLKAMLSHVSKDAIKVYLALKVQIDRINNRSAMTNAFLACQIGYSPNSKKTLQKIGAWGDELAAKGFIKKKHFRVFKENENGKTIIEKTNTYYTLVDFKDFKLKK